MQNDRIKLSTLRLSRKSISYSQDYRKYVFPIGFCVNLNTDYMPLNILKHEKKIRSNIFIFKSLFTDKVSWKYCHQVARYDTWLLGRPYLNALNKSDRMVIFAIRFTQF